MIVIDIPGNRKIEAEHLVLDFNGTLAIDGQLIDGVKPLLEQLSQRLSIHVITADTFGTSSHALSGISCSLEILRTSSQAQPKERFVQQLGGETVVAIGNGLNDSLMVKSAELGIAVLQLEGASVGTLMNADIVCTHINDALNLLLHSKRLVATLRN